MTARVPTLVLALLACACTYGPAQLNFRELEQDGVYVEQSPALSPEARPLGEVERLSRTFYFGSCDSLAREAVRELHAAAVERGGNVLVAVRFHGRTRWSSNPECRSNLNWAWLLFPMLLPIPQSIHVSGRVYFDPKR